MDQQTDVFVGINMAKSRNAIANAATERGGEVRYISEVDPAPDAMQRNATKDGRAHFCDEAGPTGYGLFRIITGMGQARHRFKLADYFSIAAGCGWIGRL